MDSNSLGTPSLIDWLDRSNAHTDDLDTFDMTPILLIGMCSLLLIIVVNVIWYKLSRSEMSIGLEMGTRRNRPTRNNQIQFEI